MNRNERQRLLEECYAWTLVGIAIWLVVAVVNLPV